MNLNYSAEDIIRLLDLQPHPVEGGFYRETWRSLQQISLDTHPSPMTGVRSWEQSSFRRERSVGTAIYYLLKPGHVSELHVLPGDEVFHFYMGSPVQMLQLWPDGSHRTVILGQDLEKGHQPQCIVPAGVWQGTRLFGNDGYALLGATMAPGFDYADYVGADRSDLIRRWPSAIEEITRLTPRG
jgi:uncharacterized protein